MTLTKRSHLITRGTARSPKRAMLRAERIGDGDFDEPIVGVAKGHPAMNTCNAGAINLVSTASKGAITD